MKLRSFSRYPGAGFLIIGGAANLLIAAAQLVIMAVGAPAYRFFEQPEMARMIEQGSPLPFFVGAGLAVVFTEFGLYGLSGAELIRRRMMQLAITLGIGGGYCLRGLAVILDLIRVLQGNGSPVQIGLSLLALVIGVLYLLGGHALWRHRLATRYAQLDSDLFTQEK